MSKMPCIRGLKCFEKKGCPKRTWNGEDGCPAFIELDMQTKGGTEVVKIRECVDIYISRLMFHNNALLEGNQIAIESFRNGMIEKGEDGKTGPKSTQAQIALAFMIQKRAMELKNEGD